MKTEGFILKKNVLVLQLILKKKKIFFGLFFVTDGSDNNLQGETSV